MELLEAVLQNDIELVKTLIHTNDVNYEGCYDVSPLTVAVTDKRIEIVKLLLEQNANVDIWDHYGNTSLVLSRDYNISKMLLKHNADVNHVGNGGYIALLNAVELNNIDIVKLLLDQPNICVDHCIKWNKRYKNRVGMNAFQLAMHLKYMEIADLIYKHVENI
jgi:ankyrin repeat protein